MAGEFEGDDADFESVLRAEASPTAPIPATPESQSISERPQPPKVQQPKPQALASKSGPSAILVSMRQKGNPILNHIKLLPWEYADIPADYVIGATTCALFLSLKYHRLHPEYVYSRIRPLAGKYLLRILLIIVDVPNHEESLKELSKTSIINNLTLILCWSAPEAAHYLELFKSCEHSQPTAIRTQQAQSYKDSLVEFVTAPRSINKSDAASLISTFGTLQNAVNAQPEQLSAVPGWGEKKVKQWCNAVREDFRVEKTKKRTAPKPTVLGETILDSNEAEGIFAETHEPAIPRANEAQDEEMDEGISAALAKFRENAS
ncbi:restriction endonuclease type II-like protein [Aspergillus granulosus]|uniref:Restriction endonuclease type II-like protein n=1 Tax=Aspergillus granulosus TaxID=176169 RepID=A0ABR4HN31_9EURO